MRELAGNLLRWHALPPDLHNRPYGSPGVLDDRLTPEDAIIGHNIAMCGRLTHSLVLPLASSTACAGLPPSFYHRASRAELRLSPSSADRPTERNRCTTSK